MNHEATIATLNMQLDNCAKDLYEKDKRIAELERQLAEASAPAVEQQKPEHVAYAENGVLHWMTGRKFQNVELYTAPQAADTDKVREAQANPHATTFPNEIWLNVGDGDAHEVGPYKDLSELSWCWERIDKYDVRYVRADLVVSMAAQAPVREVPEGWKLVPIELTDEMRAACINACYADHIDEDWAAMLAAAPLPAAPVQQDTEAAKATGTAGELPPPDYIAGTKGMLCEDTWARETVEAYGQACAEAARQPAPVVAVKTWESRLAGNPDRIFSEVVRRAMEAEIADLRAALAARSQP